MRSRSPSAPTPPSDTSCCIASISSKPPPEPSDHTLGLQRWVNSPTSWNFTTLTDGNVDFIPHAFIQQGDVKSLFYDPDTSTYQLWGKLQARWPWSNVNVNCDTSHVLLCTNTTPCPAGGTGCLTNFGQTCVPTNSMANVYEANTMVNGEGSDFTFWQVPGVNAFDGVEHVVRSNARYIPTGYVIGRSYPARWNATDGTRYLFSVTNDENVCSEWLYNPFYKSYVVMTEVTVDEVVFADGFESADTSAWSATCPPNCSSEPPPPPPF